MALRREIGLAGLTFIGIGGVLGSGWLFSPLLAAQHAGPAAILAWCIGGFAMLLLAFAFAEIVSCLPEAGAIARLPHYSHGTLVSMVIGWSAWLGYATLAPIETIAMMKYVGPLIPGLRVDSGSAGALTPVGAGVSVAILVVMTLVNALGVGWLDRANTIVTIAKIVIPGVIALTIIGTDFTPSNFTAHGGFAPNSFGGILSAVSAGGVVFGYIGFRHVIDLAGEARRPNVNVPIALVLSVVSCFAVYVLLQTAFIGGLPTEALAAGWGRIAFAHDLGPLAGIAVVTGASWLIALLYGGAVLGPLGAALIATGSNARLGMALARNGFFPDLFRRLSDRSVPLNALLLGFAVGVLILLTIPFEEMVALNSAAVVVSLCIGPLALLTLRHQLPDRDRPVRLPWAPLIAPLGFVVSALIVYWSGWSTIWRLGLAILVGFALFALKAWIEPVEGLRDWPAARWLLALLGGLAALSYLGDFGGGLHLIPLGWDLAVVSVWAVFCFWLGLRDALSPERTRALVEAAAREP